MRVAENLRVWEKNVERKIMSLLVWLGAGEAPEFWRLEVRDQEKCSESAESRAVKH